MNISSRGYGAAALAAAICCAGLPASAAGSRQPALAEVKLDGNYFSRSGHRFLPVGVHWVPAKTAMQWPVQWDPADIEADFAQMQRMGINTVRLDLMWAWFEPRAGAYNPKAFEQFDALIAMAHRHRLYLHPTLFVGGEVGEAWWDVPWRHGRNPQSDPDMLRLQTEHAREFGRRYANESAVIAWDLTDEPPFWIANDTTDAMAVNWTRLIAGGIRRHDARHPIVVGVSTQDMVHGPFRPDTIAGDVDFLSVHPYTIYTPELFPDAMVSERGTYGAAFETALSRGAGRPVMVQELGASTAQYSPEKVAQFDGASLWSSLGAGANGFLLWCYTDAAPDQYRQVPYLRSPHETQFGLTTWDRKLKPAGETFTEFARIAARLALDGVEPAAADAAILIPTEWARTRGDDSSFGLTGPNLLPYVSVTEGGAVNGQAAAPFEGNQALMSAALSSFVLARRAGLQVALPRESGDWSAHRLLLLPAPLTATEPPFVHLRTDFWARALQYVREGGVLYASLSAHSAIPDMAALFGARTVDAAVASEVSLKIVKDFGDLKAGDRFHFNVPGSSAAFWGAQLQVQGGDIIAVDEQDRPALVAHRVGRGYTLLAAYPLETYLGNQPMAFDGGTDAERLYRALRQWAQVPALVSSDQSAVEAAALRGERRGYFILVNHSAAVKQTLLSTTLKVMSLSKVGAERDTPLQAQAGGWSVEVPPYSGVVLEWRGAQP
ncbi:MAG: beta-galactosidase [Proteobacteria bacterium]|nr:beta-galactosidase [Pseudomonadota bacterium]